MIRETWPYESSKLRHPDIPLAYEIVEISLLVPVRNLPLPKLDRRSTGNKIPRGMSLDDGSGQEAQSRRLSPGRVGILSGLRQCRTRSLDRASTRRWTTVNHPAMSTNCNQCATGFPRRGSSTNQRGKPPRYVPPHGSHHFGAEPAPGPLRRCWSAVSVRCPQRT